MRSETFLNTSNPTTSPISNVAVTKFDSSGTQIIYNTIFGGSDHDDPYAMDIDASGNAYIAGYTESPNFPMLNARQTNSNTTSGGAEGFVTKLNTAGTIAYSTYHGSLNDPNDFVDDLDVDSAGNVYVVGTTRGNDFPVLNGLQNILKGQADAYLSKLSPAGVLLYSTYFGGASIYNEDAPDVAVDNQGNAYVTGWASADIPLSPNAYQTTGAGFAAKFNTTAQGSQSLVYSTHLTEPGRTIAIDLIGNAYILSIGSGFQITGVKLNATGSGIYWSFPVTAGTLQDIVADAGGNVYYAVSHDGFTSQNGIKIRKLSASSGAVLGSALLDGSGIDWAGGIAYHSGYVYLVGRTGSLNFPTTANAIQTQSNYAVPGGSSVQGFLVKMIVGADEEEDAGNVPCQGRVGMPVNVANGNMYLEQTDYVLPGVGEAINIRRTYNSMIQTSGLFGTGWASQYDEHIIQHDSDTLRMRMADGKAVYFGRSNANTFVSVSGGFYGQITVDANGIYTLTFKDGRIHKFNQQGSLTTLIDRDNNQTVLNYDATSGKLTSIVDPFGRTLTVSTDVQGRITSLSDTVGAVATYLFDTLGRLAEVIYPDNSKFTFTYEVQDSRNLLTEVKDALNNTVEKHEYYSNGKAKTSERHGGVEKYTLNYISESETHVTDALGRVTKYFIKQIGTRPVVEKIEGVCACGGSSSQTQRWEYDNGLNVTKKIDGNNRVTTYTYDANGNMLIENNPTGTKIYTYNPFGQVLMVTDQMEGVWRNTYDAKGNLLTATDALDKTTTLTYTLLGQLKTIKDARNNTTTLTYDTQGRLTEVKDANNKTTAYAYDARARLTGTTNALNHTTTFEYDLNNRLKKVTHPDSKFMTYAYDLAGRRTAMTDERNNTTTYGYDNNYRLITVTDALNHPTNFGYDAMSNRTSQTDALSNVTNYEYDEFNRLKKIIYPLAATGGSRLEEKIEYDAVGNVKKRIDTANRETLYDYDTANRLIKITDPNLKLTQFQYNARSQMTKVTDALNQIYDFTYDPMGRQLTQTRAGATMSYEYDAVGNRTKRIDYTGRETIYTYDNLNRLTNINYQVMANNAINPMGGASYAYDDISRLVSATNQAGTVSFTYDNRNRVKTSTDVHNRLVEYSYDNIGNRTQLKLDGAIHTTYIYDVTNRLTTLTDEANQNFTFGYDAANRLTTKTLPNTIQSTYNYDGMSRLTDLKHQSQTAVLFDSDYTYNPANQINQITELAQTKMFNYDNLNRLTSATYSNPSQMNETYAFDVVGNRTSSHKSATYGYQPFNRVTSTATATYAYDANGNMLSKSDATGYWIYGWDFENRMLTARKQNKTVRYQYDALGRRVLRVGKSVGVNAKYTYDGMDVILDDSNGTLTKYQNGLGIDDKLKLTSNGVSKYFLQDHLGSTVSLTDQSGNVLEQTNYDSFGNPTSNLSTRYQFTGREKDEFTGLMYYRARWFDANLGRFISEDPIGFAGDDINLYGYVWNNPIDNRDSLGLFPSQKRFYHHQNIIRKALNGLASEKQIEILAQEQYDFDAATQDEPYAPWHAMARVGQNPNEARRLANSFVRNEICLARRLSKMGFETEGLRRLSRAIHTLQDSTSPAHFDFQEAWNDSGLGSYWGHKDHYVSESLVQPKMADLAKIQTRKAWYYYTGLKEMPDDFFINDYYDSQSGPVFSPSKTSVSPDGGKCSCD